MRSLSRRKILQSTPIIAGSIIAGFPMLFSPALAKDDPPKATKPTKKTVSQAKPTDKKTDKKTK